MEQVNKKNGHRKKKTKKIYVDEEKYSYSIFTMKYFIRLILQKQQQARKLIELPLEIWIISKLCQTEKSSTQKDFQDKI